MDASPSCRNAKDTGLTNLPLHRIGDQIWCAVVVMAASSSPGPSSSRSPTAKRAGWSQRLPFRIFTVPATLATTGRQVLLRLDENAPWADLPQQG